MIRKTPIIFNDKEYGKSVVATVNIFSLKSEIEVYFQGHSLVVSRYSSTKGEIHIPGLMMDSFIQISPCKIVADYSSIEEKNKVMELFREYDIQKVYGIFSYDNGRITIFNPKVLLVDKETKTQLVDYFRTSIK